MDPIEQARRIIANLVPENAQAVLALVQYAEHLQQRIETLRTDVNYATALVSAYSRIDVAANHDHFFEAAQRLTTEWEATRADDDTMYRRLATASGELHATMQNRLEQPRYSPENCPHVETILDDDATVCIECGAVLSYG